MPVTIREIITNVTLEPKEQEARGREELTEADEAALERVVHVTVERVMARLRLEWER